MNRIGPVLVNLLLGACAIVAGLIIALAAIAIGDAVRVGGFSPCSWDPEVHTQHVWMPEENAWTCVPADQAG